MTWPAVGGPQPILAPRAGDSGSAGSAPAGRSAHGLLTSLLDLADANGAAAASGCRVGSCHSCSADVLNGAVRHDPEPLEPPAAAVALLCCAVTDNDVVLDA